MKKSRFAEEQIIAICGAPAHQSAPNRRTLSGPESRGAPVGSLSRRADRYLKLISSPP